MRTTTLIVAGIALAASGCVSMPLSPAEAVTASMAPLSRPELSLHRTPGKPPVALNLAAFGRYGEGDVFEGGEVDEILSQFNGPPPQLQLSNPRRQDGFPKEELATSRAGNRIDRVRYQPAPPKALSLGTASIDAALVVLPPGLFAETPAKGKSVDDPGQFIEQIVKALKPGAVLVVVDQKADAGLRKGDIRESPDNAKPLGSEDFKAHGLDFIGSIPAASNPDDSGENKAPEAAGRGKADRVFDIYRKPDADPGAAVPP